MDESRTAIACVNFPGFIRISLGRRKEDGERHFFFVRQDADARQTRRIRMRLNKWAQCSCSAEVVNEKFNLARKPRE